MPESGFRGVFQAHLGVSQAHLGVSQALQGSLKLIRESSTKASSGFRAERGEEKVVVLKRSSGRRPLAGLAARWSSSSL